MAVSIDTVNTPALAAASNDPWTTGVIETFTDMLLVSVAMGDWFVSTPTLTPTGPSGTSWTSRTKRGALDDGVVEIFTGVVNVENVGTHSVSTSLSSDVGGVKCFLIYGHDPTNYVNAVAGGSAVDLNNANMSITTTVDGCLILGGMVDWDSNGVPTSTDTAQGFDDADLSIAAVWKATPVGAAGTYTLNFNAAGSGSAPNCTWAAIAIAPAAGGGGGGTPGVIYLEDGSRLLLEDNTSLLKES